MALINANRILLNKTMKNKNEAIKEMAKLFIVLFKKIRFAFINGKIIR